MGRHLSDPFTISNFSFLLIEGTFVIDTSASTGHRQVFEGIQVELMADSIGTDNRGKCRL